MTKNSIRSATATFAEAPWRNLYSRDMLQKENLSDKVEVASRATSTEEIGSPVYPKAKQGA